MWFPLSFENSEYEARFKLTLVSLFEELPTQKKSTCLAKDTGILSKRAVSFN